MAEIKLTKNELRAQQVRLKQLEKYLPTLQLKKAMLQVEVLNAKQEIERLEKTFREEKRIVEENSALFTEVISVDVASEVKVKNVEKTYENIAGVEIPLFVGITFEDLEYSLFETPPWLDAAISRVQEMLESEAKVTVGEEKKIAMEKELREVSIRVNLFEKRLIPRSKKNIKKISVFLGDQQLSSVSQAKVAKGKIEAKKREKKKKPPENNIPKEVLISAN